MELACVEDEIDFRTNPNRPRPQATPGAPEVSWAMTGRIQKPILLPTQRESDSPAEVPDTRARVVIELMQPVGFLR